MFNPVTANSLPPGIDGEKIAQQVDRMLKSEVFRDSPTQQRLLQYVVQESTSGHPKDLKEYNIGVAVFQRGEGFDPRTDSIVRVQMGLLRKRLTAYYQGGGAQDPVIIEVPKGRYLPTFSLPGAPVEESRAKPGEAAAADPESPSLPPSTEKRTGRRTSWWVAIAAIAATGAGIWIWQDRRKPAPPVLEDSAHFSATQHALWKPFLGPGRRTLLVVGTPLFISLQSGLYVRDSEVNEPEQIAQSKKMKELGALAPRSSWSTEIYTGIGEAMGVSLLTRFFATNETDLPLLRNRLARWQDATDGNLILLASLRFHTLNRELDLPSDFVLMDRPQHAPAIQPPR